MNKNSIYVLLGVIIALLVLGTLYFQFAQKAAAPSTATSTPAMVSFQCASGTIQAAFASSSASLKLSDGRSFTLPQTMAADGARYESTSTPNTDIVFWNKGDTAFLTENGQTTYQNCVINATPGSEASTTGAANSTSGTSTFTDRGHTFSFQYPSQFTVSGGDGSYTTEWMSNATTSGMLLARMDVPASYMPKTNFASSMLTVGTSADPKAVAGCLTFAESGGGAPIKGTATINGVTYTTFVTTDAGAGNQYRTTSYRTIRNSQCYAIEYTIHSTNLGNYSPDQGVTAFDQQKVQELFEGVVRSFMFL